MSQNPSYAFAYNHPKNYDLSAVFMRNWDTRDESGTDVGCEWEKDWEDVQRVCGKLDIPCQMVRTSNRFDPLALDTTKNI
jgi:tRNA U34 2-thiouridine synthase MnmA/TrmU